MVLQVNLNLPIPTPMKDSRMKKEYLLSINPLTVYINTLQSNGKDLPLTRPFITLLKCFLTDSYMTN